MSLAAFGNASLDTWLLALILLASLAANAYLYVKTRKREQAASVEKNNSRQAVRLRNTMAETLDQLNDYVFFHDMSGNFYEFNAAVERDSQYTARQLRHMNIRDLVPEPYKHQVSNYLERIGRNGSDRGYMRIVSRTGRQFILEYNCNLIRGDRGEPAGVRGVARNITQQVQTRKALEKSEKKYRTILESIEDGYYEVDLGGHYQFLNRAALRILGYAWDEIEGKSYRNLIAEEDRSNVFETFNYVYCSRKPVKAFHWRAIRADGSICHVETSVSLITDDSGNPAGFQGIVRDITERVTARDKQKELEEQLQQAQKMESIGTLAGGIAHDFNNILFPMIGYTELAMQDLPEDSLAYQNLQKVMESSERARALVQQILNFSRQSANEPAEPVYIQPVIKETLKLLKNTIPSSIDISSDIQEDAGKAVINLARMHQVIMNLCTNAYQAMEKLDSGRLRVELKQIEITEETSFHHHHLSPGAYICISVSDTGCGIPAEIQEKIFDPYFTTKSQEKGTGLGLSVSYGIIKNAGGTIRVDSEPGRGAAFYVYLPVAEESVEVVRTGDLRGALPTGSGRILVVDDEQQIVELEKQMLESLGYEVIPRTSSIEAEQAFNYQPDRFDLLVTDQTMPNKSGLELIKSLREKRPDLPVILCTGYSERVSRKKTENLGIDAVLLKPISKNDLAVTVNNALDRTAPKQKPQSE